MKSLKRMNGASSIGQKATKYFAKATYCHNSKLYYDLEKSDRNSWLKTGDRVGFFLNFISGKNLLRIRNFVYLKPNESSKL